MLEETLQKLDLNSKEIEVYLFLLNNGPSLAPQIVSATKVNRTNTYAVLNSLSNKGLIIEKKQPAKRKTIYAASNPASLAEMVENKEDEFIFIKKNFGETYNIIKTLYQSSTEKPIVQIFSGLKGVKTLYDKMLTATEEILIFVSRHDRDNQGHEELIEQNIADRARKGIHVRALNAHQQKYPLSGLPDYIEMRRKELTEVRLLPSEFVFPSQIIVFDNTVGITSLKKDLTTTIIENQNIANTQKMIFNFIWEASLAHHKNLLKQATDFHSN